MRKKTLVLFLIPLLIIAIISGYYFFFPYYEELGLPIEETFHPISDIQTLLEGSTEPTHYEAVDDVTADNDLTYVWSEDDATAAVEQIDIYGFENLTVSGINIIYVAIYIRIRSTSISYPADFRAVCRINGTDYFGSDFLDISTTYSTYLAWNMTTNPATGANWTVDEVNEAGYGVGITSGVEVIPDFVPSYQSYPARMTQIYIQVSYEYAPPSWKNLGHRTNNIPLAFEGEKVTFYCEWSGNLSGWIFSWNHSKTGWLWVNQSWTAFVDSWSNISLTFPIGTKVYYKFYANSTQDLWSETDTYEAYPYRSPKRAVQILMDRMWKRKLSPPHPPLIQQWRWVGNVSKPSATAEQLSGVIAYELTGNSTYLDWVEEYLTWLNTSQVCYLFTIYNITAQEFRDYSSPFYGSWQLLLFSKYVYNTGKFKSLLEKAVANYTAIQSPQDNLFCKDAHFFNGTKVGHTVCVAHSIINSISATAVAMAGYALDNATWKEFAANSSLNFKFSPYNLTTYGFIIQTKAWWAHEQALGAVFGHVFPMLIAVYHLTNDSAVYNRLKDYLHAFANYQVCWWKDTYFYLVNRTGYATVNRTAWGIGFGEEALIVLYLLTGNSTFLDKARDNHKFLIIDKNFLINNLINRLADFDPYTFTILTDWEHSVPRFTSCSIRSVRLLYRLNVTGFLGNKTFWDSIWMLYGAMERYHARNWGGFRHMTDSDNPCGLSGAELHSWFYDIAEFYHYFRMFPYPGWTDISFDTLEELLEGFGTPFISLRPVEHLKERWNSFYCKAIDVGRTLGEINSSLIYENLPWLVLSKQNATGYYTFVRGYRWNADIQIYSTDEILWIYVTSPCVWKRLYP